MSAISLPSHSSPSPSHQQDTPEEPGRSIEQATHDLAITRLKPCQVLPTPQFHAASLLYNGTVSPRPPLIHIGTILSAWHGEYPLHAEDLLHIEQNPPEGHLVVQVRVDQQKKPVHIDLFSRLLTQANHLYFLDLWGPEQGHIETLHLGSLVKSLIAQNPSIRVLRLPAVCTPYWFVPTPDHTSCPLMEELFEALKTGHVRSILFHGVPGGGFKYISTKLKELGFQHLTLLARNKQRPTWLLSKERVHVDHTLHLESGHPRPKRDWRVELP